MKKTWRKQKKSLLQPKKVFQNKSEDDEKLIIRLEKEIREARDKAEAADTSYDEFNKN